MRKNGKSAAGLLIPALNLVLSMSASYARAEGIVHPEASVVFARKKHFGGDEETALTCSAGAAECAVRQSEGSRTIASKRIPRALAEPVFRRYLSSGLPRSAAPDAPGAGEFAWEMRYGANRFGKSYSRGSTIEESVFELESEFDLLLRRAK